jgi:AAA+ superfamily predicted ATPase
MATHPKAVQMTMAGIRAFQKEFPEENYPCTIAYGNFGSLQQFQMLQNKFILEIKEHKDEGIFTHHVGMLTNKTRMELYFNSKKVNPAIEFRDIPSFGNKTGIVTLRIKGDLPLALVSYAQYQGAIVKDFHQILIGSPKAFRALTEYKCESIDEQETPKPGIYRAFLSQHRVIYTRLKKLSQPVIFHPELSTIREHIISYFANVEKFTINNSPGRKASLIFGPQGTGKTSIVSQIAEKLSDKISVIFTTDVEVIQVHANLCAKYNVPTIIIAEDFMDNVKDLEKVSDVKNFLSGVDTMRNIKGCYLVMTSNYPERIDMSIIHRKGRVDRLFKVDKLPVTSPEFIQCFEHYLAPYVDKNALGSVMSRLQNVTENAIFQEISALSGSEIEAIAKEAQILAWNDGSAVSFKHVKQVIEEMQEELKKLESFSMENDSKLGKSIGEAKKVGFKQ